MANSPLIVLPEPIAPAVAWLFPGQGAQEVGMGADLWQASPAARAVFDAADSALGYELSAICFEGPAERLTETSIAQPAILTVSVACLAAALESGSVRERPAFMAGHSVGEYAALVASGAMSFEAAVRLVQERARLMAVASAEEPGTLAAILGSDEETVEGVCRDAGVDVCNRNLPTQTVIGGSKEAIARAIELAKERGAYRAMELQVSGAFHSRLMAPAAEGMKAAVASTDIEMPAVTVIANVTASPFESIASIRDELVQQVVSPVRWHESAGYMAAAGVSEFIEFGPGRVLTGLVKRLIPGAGLRNVSSWAEATAFRDTAVQSSA